MSIEMTTRVIRPSKDYKPPTWMTTLSFSTWQPTAMSLFDDIGRRIWELIETPRRVEELCAQLTGEFNGDPNRFRQMCCRS